MTPGSAEALPHLSPTVVLSKTDFATLGAVFALQANLIEIIRMARMEIAAHGALQTACPALSDWRTPPLSTHG
ncbi:MAG: hypothetical protein ACOYOJ_12945 [Alsobacter sp.]